MKKVQRFLFVLIFAVPFLTVSPVTASAQANQEKEDHEWDNHDNDHHDNDHHDNDNHDNDNHKDNDDHRNGSVPIDGGLSILLLAGMGYGLKKVYDKTKNEEEQA